MKKLYWWLRGYQYDPIEDRAYVSYRNLEGLAKFLRTWIPPVSISDKGVRWQVYISPLEKSFLVRKLWKNI